MHNHHAHCNHNLQFCGQCDKVYCNRCSREWGSWNYWSNYPSIFQGSGTTYATGTAGTGISGSAPANCGHATGGSN